jgi:hypothetical protein
MGPLVKFVGGSVVVGVLAIVGFVLSVPLIVGEVTKIERKLNATCYEMGSR